MEKRQAGRRRQRVADEQAAENGRRAGEGDPARGPQPEGDGDRSERDGRRDEAQAGATPFLEVRGREGSVDAGADRAGEGHEIAPHCTTTVPFMSVRCSVQT